MKKNVVIFSRASSEAVMEDLRERYNLSVFLDPLGNDREAFMAALAEADGMLGANLKLGEEILKHAPRLKVISSISAGYDNYDLEYLQSRGIQLTNTPDAVTETTADTGFMLLMMTARRAVELAEHIKTGQWTASIGAAHFGVDVHGKRLGIIGLGRIGAALARRAHFGFEMSILYCGNSDKPQYEAEFGAKRLEMDELLGEADFICVCVPLSEQTRHLIGAREFALMRPDTLFINIARGPVVDEAALIEALRAGQLHGAGLDVFEQEPLPTDSPLLAMPNVVALPHIGSATVEARELMARTAANNLIAVLDGETPAYPILIF
ncbi:2-hydroxyacid dehydrogenase [Azomonas macrocytogenes]|uniref:Glyoxylate/hydroxypyruvate reductase B n=1 Tax=Azomonas macrocytogenes TaxID=69962 RepID=A0A839T871_AZOMA|nr:D-glycerate dehydrogenase [Azomonas macrocytogenes]MBB3104165.1 phosphogluconate 2-dehydrogenase [Azomonas macrocytogenes]